MMKQTIKPIVLAVGLAIAAPAAIAANIDFSGTNIYMGFLDGDRHAVSTGDGFSTTSDGGDQGQFSEINVMMKAVISKKVEAGVRIQSRSSASWWSDNSFAFERSTEAAGNRSSWMKLRGAYIQITPGYDWLNLARVGSNDWGMFDPFTWGRARYIDRDNHKGFYFRGPLVGGGNWEAARVSMLQYHQSNFGQGPTCCNGGEPATDMQEALWIGQVKVPVGAARLTASAQTYADHIKVGTDTTPYDGQDVRTFATNRVYMLKGEGNVTNALSVGASLYRSEFDADSTFKGEDWGNTPKASVNDSAFKIDVSLSETPIAGLSLNYQYFNIGEGYYSAGAARTESDVLLTEGSEAGWFGYAGGWGETVRLGGMMQDYTQVAAGPKNAVSPNGMTRGNGLTNNDVKVFTEAPSESVVGWKGHTVVANYEIANTPLTMEYSNISYNNNWQGYTGPLTHWFNADQDRKTSIFLVKGSHSFQMAGGFDMNFKAKWVNDEDTAKAGISTDDAETKDRGYSVMFGKNLHNDFYASVGYGYYTRDITVGAKEYDNHKGIWTIKGNYTLSGLEGALVAQWISGKGDPTMSGKQSDLEQYRLWSSLSAKF